MCLSMFQSPRQDLLENLRYSVSQEYQKKFEIEKGRFEDQLTQLREDHEAALAELKVCHFSPWFKACEICCKTWVLDDL